MKKKILLGSLFAVTTFAAVGTLVLSQSPSSFSLSATPSQAEWHHYNKRLPTSSQKGIREYWVQCAGNYQFTEPQDVTIVDKGSAYDESEFAVDDDRYFSYKFDEDNLGFDYYNYGALKQNTASADPTEFRTTYEHGAVTFTLWSDGGNKLVWKIMLPRIDYRRYPTVTMTASAPNWYSGNGMGPEADQLNYHSWDGNKTGTIKLTLRSTGLLMEFNEWDHNQSVAFTNTFTDQDIISGLKSAYFYTEDLYDRNLVISNVQLATEASPEDIYSYAQDKTKIDVADGTAKLITDVAYDILNEGYATVDTGLCASGDSYSNGITITLPAINFNNYTANGNVSFKFGVKNNDMKMFFGAFDSADKVDLGSSSSTTETSNYVNWEMVISSESAYIKNVLEDHSYPVTLTAGMRAGTERMAISSSVPSVYRNYFVSDFYWHAA